MLNVMEIWHVYLLPACYNENEEHLVFKGHANKKLETQKYSNLVIICDEFDLLQQAEISNEIVL